MQPKAWECLLKPKKIEKGNMGTKKNVTISGAEDTIKIVEAPKVAATADTGVAQAEQTDQIEQAEKVEEVKKPNKKTVLKKTRSQKYKAVRSKIDKTKSYSPADAVALVKKLSYTNFDGTISANAQVREIGEKINITFPHSTGKSLKVAILDDKVLADIEAGTFNFDVLLAVPKDMSKLSKHARILGPKGLMPNPKNGTLTPNPEMKKKELEAGKITLKTEKKAPLIHTVIGKISMEDKALIENLETLINALKNKLVKIGIAATMSPGIKVAFEE